MLQHSDCGGDNVEGSSVFEGQSRRQAARKTVHADNCTAFLDTSGWSTVEFPRDAWQPGLFASMRRRKLHKLKPSGRASEPQSQMHEAFNTNSRESTPSAAEVLARKSYNHECKNLFGNSGVKSDLNLFPLQLITLKFTKSTRRRGGALRLRFPGDSQCMPSKL